MRLWDFKIEDVLMGPKGPKSKVEKHYFSGETFEDNIKELEVFLRQPGVLSFSFNSQEETLDGEIRACLTIKRVIPN